MIDAFFHPHRPWKWYERTTKDGGSIIHASPVAAMPEQALLPTLTLVNELGPYGLEKN